MRRKHVPQRTCIGCRQVKSKREMIRLVRTPEGQLVVDDTGKRNGRGTYLCRQKACWETALEGNRLGKALQMDVDRETKEMLRDIATTLAQ